MSSQTIATVVWSVALVAVVALFWWLTRPKGPSERQPRSGPGPGAMGAVYGLLQEDKRRAIELIVEGGAEATDPEHADDKPKAGA